MADEIPTPRTAPAVEHPCQLYAHNTPPRPIRTQFHHSKPVYLQNRLYGEIRFGPDVWLCGLCHDAVHEILDWMLGEGRKPNPTPSVRSPMYREAAKTWRWFLNEESRILGETFERRERFLLRSH
jgi:hypothetical protein